MARECLPLKEVLDKLLQVEGDVAGFYTSASDIVRDDEVRGIFASLLAEKKATEPTLASVCESLACGDTALEQATPEDLQFLSALTESSFYRHAGRPAELADPQLRASHLVDNALKLEKDLLLFYTKFYATSCSQHRPVFSQLIQRGQRHISELNNIRLRLKRGLTA